MTDRAFHLWAKEQDARRAREARIFSSGFFLGVMAGGMAGLCAVLLALFIRG